MLLRWEKAKELSPEMLVEQKHREKERVVQNYA